MRHDATRSVAARLIDRLLLLGSWHRWEARAAAWPAAKRWTLLAVAAAIGLGARLVAQTGFRNYDFESYLVVSGVMSSNGSPYLTGRYNYGPPWALIVWGLRAVTEDPDRFRVALALLLTAVDVLIAVLLARRGYLLAGALLMISPVSIAITGQHQQFDNLAILVGLVAVSLVIRVRGPIAMADVLVVLLLGMSLSIKHVFLVFPLWLAMRMRTWPRILLYALAPPAVFVLSLAIPLLQTPEAVWENVFAYRSFDNSPLMSAVLPAVTQTSFWRSDTPEALFLCLLLLLGWVFRKASPFEAALVYLVSLVTFSTAIADQYWAIAMPGAAVFLNAGFLLWLVLASISLAGNPATLGWPVLEPLRESLAERLSLANPTYAGLAAAMFTGWLLMAFRLLVRGTDPPTPEASPSEPPTTVEDHH